MPGLQRSSVRRPARRLRAGAKTADVAQVLADLRDDLVPLVQAIIAVGPKAAGRNPLAELSRRRRRKHSARPPPRRSASISSAAGSTSRIIRFAAAWARTTAASRRATTSNTSPRPSSASCTRRGTASTTRACGTDQFGLPPGIVRVAGHPRIAVADVGEPCRPQPGVLAALLPAVHGGVSRSGSGACRSISSSGRSTRRPVADPRRSRRSDVQPAHHHSLRAGAGTADRRLARGRAARRVEGEVPEISGHRAARRRRRLLAGHPLVGGADRLFSDVFAGQSLRRPVLRAGRTPTWAASTSSSPAASSQPLKRWLQTNIHQRGQCYPAADLVQAHHGPAALARPAHAASPRPSWGRCMGCDARRQFRGG